jgi:hypothetical protein
MIDTPEATYEPWTDGYAVGFKATRKSDGRVEYVYLNPSSETDDGQPNVFLYAGSTGHPALDHSIVYHDVFKVGLSDLPARAN